MCKYQVAPHRTAPPASFFFPIAVSYPKIIGLERLNLGERLGWVGGGGIVRVGVVASPSACELLHGL
jgi:hypothetical protein